MEIVYSYRQVGITPSSTNLALCQLDSNISTTLRDIYNINAEFDRIQRQGLSPPEALIVELETQKGAGVVKYYMENDGQGHITFLFIATCKSVKYLNRNAEIVMLNCIYKTNKFGMPLLYIMGV